MNKILRLELTYDPKTADTEQRGAVRSRELLYTVILEVKTTQHLENYRLFSLMLIEQKMFLFDLIIDIRDDLARP